MLRRLRIVAVLLGAAALAAGAPASAAIEYPQGGGAKNVVLASTTADGSTLERSGVQVAPVFGDTVASENLALAHSTSCTGCHASAVAVQVIFYTSPRVFVPHNAAVAANTNCSSCVSYAYAWQHGVQTKSPVVFDGAVQQRIAELRREIAEAVATAEPWSFEAAEALTARLDELTAELESVVDAAAVSAGAVPGASAREVHSQAD